MKRNIPLLIFICVVLGLQAQAQNTNITGIVYDDVTKEAIEMASIRVLNASDSAYVTGAATDAKGKFSISAKHGTYIVQVSFMSYISQYFKVNARNGIAILGDVYLKEDAVMLKEAVVEAKAPEIIVKGDTVEYNADSYKVQETAVLADLIKKIPGAEIDAEGKITINGKDITKILVDGKEFFSNDPKVASENLPAKMIEKLQVLDQKSDMARLTGFDDGEEQTVINLVARPGMKEGIMATANGGYGSEDRYEAGGFVNIAKDANRFTALGNFNNNNNAGGSSGGRRWGGNRGVTETAMGGINIAMEPSEKLKYDGDIQYNGRDNDVESETSTKYNDGSMSEFRTSTQNTNNKDFNTRLRFEWTPDSLTNIIFRPDVSYNRATSMSVSNTDRKSSANSDRDFLSDGNSFSKGHTFRFNGNLLINRRLNNKGRSLSFEVSGGLSDGDTDGSTYSRNDYYNIDSLSIQDQIYNQKNNSYNWRTRISYMEPLGWNNFLELSYDIRNTHSETDKVTYDKDATDGYTDLAEDYTRNTKNDFLNQRISANFQSRRQSYNYTIGMELMPSRSKTSVEKPNAEESRNQAKNYFNFAPRLEFNYLWSRQHNLRIRYNGETNQATTDQLFDGIITQTATDTTWGNPDLKPSFQHRLEFRYRKYIPERASSIMAFLNFNYIMNDIVSLTRTGAGNSRNTTYENMDGNMTGRAMFMFNTPLRNKKFSINTNTFAIYTRDNTYLFERDSDIKHKNTANVYSLNERLGLKFNSDKFQFDVGGNLQYKKSVNSYSKDENKTTYDYGGFTNFTWYLPYNFVLASDINYSTNSGYDAGYKLNSWIWNAELAKDFNISFKSGDDKTSLPATLKFRIYDILKDQTNITRSSDSRMTSYTSTNTIGSYFMLGLTIRFQSFKGMKSSDMEGPRMRGMGHGGGGRRPMSF